MKAAAQGEMSTRLSNEWGERRKHMAMNTGFPNIDEASVLPALREAREKLNGTECEVVLDFSSVRRVGQDALKAIEELASVAGKKNVRVVLRGVNVEVYKVLKLMHLTGRVLFVN